MNQGNLTQKHMLALRPFMMGRKSITEAAKELGVPYQTFVRYTRDLIKAGYLIETGFRENNRRYYIAVKTPTDSAHKDSRARIYFSGEVLTIEEVLNKLAPNNEVPVRQDVLIGLVALAYRARAKQDHSNPGGMSPTDVQFVFRRIRTKLALWVEFLDALVDNNLIWFDDTQNGERVGIDLVDAETHIAEFTRRYMAEEKGPLER